MDILMSMIVPALGVIILFLLLMKLVLFNKATSHKTFMRFLYFSTNSIYTSDTNKKIRAKIFQNRISFIILILMVILIILIKFLYLR